MILKIGWLYRFTKHWMFVLKTKEDAVRYRESISWQPWPTRPGRPEYEAAYVMAPGTIFMVIANHKSDKDLYQILFNDKIGYINYKYAAQIDTSLNP